MATRAVRAIRREDGRFETLEQVEVPTGAVVTLTYEEAEPERGKATLPTWPGTVKGTLSRDEIYDHL